MNIRDPRTELNPNMLPKVRSEILTKAIEGMPCDLRIASFAGLRCADGTSVGCHPPIFGKGISTKVTDLSIISGCATCHELLDMKNPLGWHIQNKYPHAFWQQLFKAQNATQARLLGMGIIIVKGGEII